MTSAEQALLAARPDFAAIAHWVKSGARVLDIFSPPRPEYRKPGSGFASS